MTTREIKFRAWDIELKIMLNNYAENSLSSGGINVSEYHPNTDACYARNLVLMQYTGREDFRN